MHFKQTQIFEQQSAPKRRMRGLGILCGLIALMPIPVLAADEDEQTYTPPPLFGAAAPAEGSSRSKEVFIHVQKAAPIQSMRQAKVLPSSPQAKKEQKPQVIIIGSDNQGRAEIEDTGPRIMKFEVKSRKINLADEMNKEKEEAAKTNKAAKAAPAKKAKILAPPISGLPAKEGKTRVIIVAQAQCVRLPKEVPAARTELGNISEIKTQITAPCPTACAAIKRKT